MSRVREVFWIPRRPSRGSEFRGRQSRASCPQNGSRGARSVQSSTSCAHRPSPHWAGGAVSTVGSRRDKSAQAVLPGEGCEERAAARCFSLSPGVCAAGSEPGPRRHSTKKRTSTMSRTTKRTAMAHHWRRSGRQDRRVSLPGPDLPQDTVTGQLRQHLGMQRAENGQMMAKRGPNLPGHLALDRCCS